MTPDTPPDVPSRVNRNAVQQLHQLMEGGSTDSETAYQALAMYEAALGSAHQTNATDAYGDLMRAYRESLIDLLDTVAQSEGWSFIGRVGKPFRLHLRSL